MQATLFRRTYARWPGKCPKCERGYKQNALIVQVGDGWAHYTCADGNGPPDDAIDPPEEPKAETKAQEPQNNGQTKPADNSSAIVAICSRLETCESAIDKQAQQSAAILDELAAIRKQRPRVLTFKRHDKPEVTIADAHPLLPKILAHVNLGENILLVGPRGSGKTTLAAQIATSLSLEFSDQSCSGGITETAFLGRLCPVTGEYRPTPFVQQYENGGVFLFDEIDAADPNVLIVLNSALANGHITLPARTGRNKAPRHADFRAVAAANTYGLGADRIYAGRQQLDGATLDRFTVFDVDYSESVETQLCPDDDLRGILWQWRANLRGARVLRDIGTRQIAKAYQWKHALGYDLAEIRALLCAGWRADEIKKMEG